MKPYERGWNDCHFARVLAVVRRNPCIELLPLNIIGIIKLVRCASRCTRFWGVKLLLKRYCFWRNFLLVKSHDFYTSLLSRLLFLLLRWLLRSYFFLWFTWLISLISLCFVFLTKSAVKMILAFAPRTYIIDSALDRKSYMLSLSFSTIQISLKRYDQFSSPNTMTFAITSYVKFISCSVKLEHFI